MENIPLLHYNFMSHVCHVRRTNFRFIIPLVARSLVHGYNAMACIHEDASQRKQQPPNASLRYQKTELRCT